MDQGKRETRGSARNEGRGGGRNIRAATWIPPDQLAHLVRKCLDELDYEFERSRSQKSFSKLVFVLPLPKNTYVFDFLVKKPVEFRIMIYETHPTPSAVVHFFEVHGLRERSSPHIRKLVARMVEKMPRKPWKFSFSERFRYGFLAPEYVIARRRWRALGAE